MTWTCSCWRRRTPQNFSRYFYSILFHSSAADRLIFSVSVSFLVTAYLLYDMFSHFSLTSCLAYTLLPSVLHCRSPADYRQFFSLLQLWPSKGSDFHRLRNSKQRPGSSYSRIIYQFGPNSRRYWKWLETRLLMSNFTHRRIMNLAISITIYLSNLLNILCHDAPDQLKCKHLISYLTYLIIYYGQSL